MSTISFSCRALSIVLTLALAATLLPQHVSATFGHAGDCHFDVSCNGTVERSVDGDLAPGNHIEITTGNCPVFKSSLGPPYYKPKICETVNCGGQCVSLKAGDCVKKSGEGVWSSVCFT